MRENLLWPWKVVLNLSKCWLLNVEYHPCMHYIHSVDVANRKHGVLTLNQFIADITHKQNIAHKIQLQ